MTDRTPGPWKVDTDGFNHYGLPRVLGSDGCIVAGVMQTQANAEFIVRACNAHDQLLEALRGLMDIAEIAMPDSFFQSDGRVKAARKALEA